MSIRPMTYLLGAVAGAAVIAASSLPAMAHAPAPTSAATAAGACGYYSGNATTRRGNRGDRVKEPNASSTSGTAAPRCRWTASSDHVRRAGSSTSRTCAGCEWTASSDPRPGPLFGPSEHLPSPAPAHRLHNRPGLSLTRLSPLRWGTAGRPRVTSPVHPSRSAVLSAAFLG